MFDIGWSEMAVILLVALVVIGPRDLPRVARTMGKWVAKGRAMAREFQSALEDMAREAELDKVKNEIEKAGRTDLGKTIEKNIDPSGELGKAFDPKAKPADPKAKPADPKAKPADPKAKPAAKKTADTDTAATSGGGAAPAQPAPAKDAAAAPKNGAGAEAAADPQPASGDGERKSGRAHARAPEREAVPADPS